MEVLGVTVTLPKQRQASYRQVFSDLERYLNAEGATTQQLAKLCHTSMGRITGVLGQLKDLNRVSCEVSWGKSSYGTFRVWRLKEVL